jgi:hypothetical protein
MGLGGFSQKNHHQLMTINDNQEQSENTERTVKEQKPWQFKPGVSGNPKGRPKGSISIKDLVRKHLENNPEDLKEFVSHFIKDNRELAWQMLEGRPSQDLTSKGEAINPAPIYNAISRHGSNQENLQLTQENQGG